LTGGTFHLQAVPDDPGLCGLGSPVFIVRHSDLIICKVEGSILKRAELSVRQLEKSNFGNA